MVATIISGNDRVSLPDDVREALGLQDGEVVSVEQSSHGVLLRRTVDAGDHTAGILSQYAKHPPASIEDERAAFELAVAEEVAGRDRR